MNLIIGFVLISSPLIPISAEDTCTTPECIHAASEVLSNIDPNVDPCDDFYSFACGSYINGDHAEGMDNPYIASKWFRTLTLKVDHQLRIVVEEPIHPDEIHPLVLPKQLYKACMNKEAIDKRGIEPLREALSKLGGWPVVEGDNWNETEWSWVDSMRQFREIGFVIDPFLDVILDTVNQTTPKIRITPSSIFQQGEGSTKRRYIAKEVQFEEKDAKDMDFFLKYMVTVADLLGVKVDQALQELEPTTKFFEKLLNASFSVSEEVPQVVLMTIESFEISYPEIPLLALLNTIISGLQPIDKEEEVEIAVSPLFLQELNNLLARTPKRVVANHFLNSVILNLVPVLSEEIKCQVSAATHTKEPTEIRSAGCLKMVSSLLPDAVSMLYIQKYYDEDARKPALDIINGIQAATINVIKKLDWMNEETKTYALDKAKSILTHFAYSEELLDHEKLSDRYNELQLSEDLFFESYLNATRFKIKEEYSIFGQPFNFSEHWIQPVFEVNAFYSQPGNLIEFPAGILQRPFLSSKRPQYMNYGSLGFIIGHEIIHAFDTQGRNFNKEGFLIDWWDKETEENYANKVRCILKQYSNYTEPTTNLSLNAVKTVGEDIADNCGVKVAYLAYKNWVQNNSPEQRLPGLNYSPEQMFWISSANVWCASYTPEQVKMKLKKDEHSIERFRVIGSFSNSDDFARDFNCPVGSPMNPSKKCKI